jgi:protein O-mannosyl-transferase
VKPRRLARLPAVVFVVAVLQYAQTAWFDFAWDDKLVITANEYTKKGMSGLPDIFTKRVSIPYKSEYRPVPQALHAIEYDLFGGRPAAGHVFNILWYALTCVLVYAFVRFVFVRLDPLFALLAALLFVVHPLHVEVVANIKGRDEILTLAFGLSAVMLLVTAMERGRWLLAGAGVGCFVVACLSKTNAVTLLPLVPLVAWYRSPEFAVSRRLAISTLVIAASAVALVVGIRYLQGTVSTDLNLHLNSTVLNNIFLWTTRTETIVPTSLVNIGRYLLLFVYPYPLIHLYGHDQIPLSSWTNLLPWLIIAGLVTSAIVMLRTWDRKAPWAFGVVWCAMTYSAYSNFFFYAPDTMADRYMFIPSIGLSLVAVFALFRLAGLDLERAVIARRRARWVMYGAGVVLVAYFARTIVVSRDWRNDTTLIYNRIQYMEHNAAAQAIYGHTLLQESEREMSPERRLEQRSAAMRAYTQAIRIYPDFQAAWLAIGKLFAEQGIFDKAELAFLKAQRLVPLSPDGYFSLGTLHLAQRELPLAIPYLEKAILLDPELEEAYVMLGRAYLQGNHIDNLGSMTTTARKWFPDNVDVEALRAAYYFRSEKYPEAFALASEVARKAPQNFLANTILSSPLAQEFSGKGGERQ